MTKKQKRIKLFDLFKPKSVKNNSEQEPLQYNEIIVTEHGTISLKSMVLTAKRQGNFYVGETVTVEADGYITGSIVCAAGVVKGRVKGKITCMGELIINPTAIVEGDLIAKTVTVESGSIINGTLSVSDDILPSLLTDKLHIAKALLSDGLIPAIETVDLPEPEKPPQAETAKSTVKQKKRGQKNVKTNTTANHDNQSSEGKESMGSWW